jgi:hypothetical protein
VSLFGYFDLNQRANAGKKGLERDVLERSRSRSESGKEERGIEDGLIHRCLMGVPESLAVGVKRTKILKEGMPLWEQLLMYCGLFLGVLFSSAVQQLMNAKPINQHFFIWQTFKPQKGLYLFTQFITNLLNKLQIKTFEFSPKLMYHSSLTH